MAGKRIIELEQLNHWNPDYELPVDYGTQSTAYIPEALGLYLAQVGNTYFQGSTDGINWHDEILTGDTEFRFSTDGGIIWKSLGGVCYSWDVKVGGVTKATISNKEYVNFIAGTNVTITGTDTGSGANVTINCTTDPGTGVDNFIDLIDTDPTTYTGYAGYSVVVNVGEDGLTFTYIEPFVDAPDSKWYVRTKGAWVELGGVFVEEGKGIDVYSDSDAVVSLDISTLDDEIRPEEERDPNYIYFGYYDSLLPKSEGTDGPDFNHFKESLADLANWTIWDAKYIGDIEVDVTTITSGDTLIYNGTKFIPGNPAAGDGYWTRNTTYSTNVLHPTVTLDCVMIGNSPSALWNPTEEFIVDGSSLFMLDHDSTKSYIYFNTGSTILPLFRYTSYDNNLILQRYSGSAYADMVSYDWSHNYLELGSSTGLILSDTTVQVDGNIRWNPTADHYQGWKSSEGAWINLDEEGGGGTSITVSSGTGTVVVIDGDDYTVNTGNPLTITSSTGNTFSGIDHTHALDTVLSNPGPYSDPILTVDAKGRITAITSGGGGSCYWIAYDKTLGDGIYYYPSDLTKATVLIGDDGSNSAIDYRFHVRNYDAGLLTNVTALFEGSSSKNGVFIKSGSTIEPSLHVADYQNSTVFDAYASGKIYMPRITDTVTSKALYFNTTTGEVTYGDPSGGGNTYSSDQGINVIQFASNNIRFDAYENAGASIYDNTPDPQVYLMGTLSTHVNVNFRLLDIAAMQWWNANKILSYSIDAPTTDYFLKFDGTKMTWGAASTGGSTVITDMSVVGDGSIGNKVKLQNDSENPGTYKYYRTAATGLDNDKGWADPYVFTTMSVTGVGSPSTPVKLVNDETTPTANKYYGTNGAGTKGYHALTTGLAIGDWIEDITYDYNDIETESTNSYTLDPLASFAYTIISFVHGCDAGTITGVSVNKNGSPITNLSGLTVTTSTTVTVAGTNSIAETDVITLTCTSTTGAPSQIIGKLRIRRI